MKNKETKIALFFGGKISRHLVLIKKAAKKLGVRLDLVSYNRVFFDTETLKVRLRKFQISTNNFQTNTKFQITNNKKNDGVDVNEYDVLFFRTTGKHWEEVDLINYQLKITNYELGEKPIIVDPIVLSGKPSMACKAYQMLTLKRSGIEVPKTVYGSLWFLFETMRVITNNQIPRNKQLPITKFQETNKKIKNNFNFPIIIKGSGGDRGTRVFKADNMEELEKLVRTLRKSETEEGKRYMLQEFIPNNGDYRVLVLGKKVLGVMKRSSQSLEEFKNNYSAGGKVELATLPQNILDLAVRAAEVCGLAVAGVDVMEKHNYELKITNYELGNQEKMMSENPEDYVILEVNKGPQFKGFMQATGINVPEEIVKYLVSLKH